MDIVRLTLLGSAGQQDDEVVSVPAVVDAVAGASVDPQLEYVLADSAVVPETAELDTVETRLDRARISALWSRNHVSNASVPSAVT